MFWRNNMKRIIAFITTMAVLAFMPYGICADNETDTTENPIQQEYNTETATVYVTVSDITDYTEPLNVLYERQAIEVSNFNLAEFGDTLEGITCINGITYLHALVQLHRNLYGDDKVKEKLLLTTDGVTKIFMGKSVANVMYKNGRDIFSLPQLVNIKDGDEIQVCLYDEGHSQAIATFNEARIDNVSPDEIVSLKLEQYYGYPRDRDPIEGAEITDGEGVYLTDTNGNILTTNADGDFNVSFPKEGTYTISAMPTINYYMTDTGGGIKQEWVMGTVWKEEIVKTNVVPNDPICTDIATGFDGEAGISMYEAEALWNAYGFEQGSAMVLYDWESGDDEPLAIITNGGIDVETVENVPTEGLVLVETVIPEGTYPMVTYTTPFVTVNVTTDLIIDDVYLTGTRLNVVTKNSQYHQQDDIYIGAYSIDEDGNEILEDMRIYPTVQEEYAVDFSGYYDIYKVFCWADGTMRPIREAYTFNPNASTQTVTDYTFTMAIPWNTYVTSN